jgi:hypothetical protein
MYNYLAKNGLGYILGDFFTQTHPVTLIVISRTLSYSRTRMLTKVEQKNKQSKLIGSHFPLQGDQIGRIFAFWVI